MTSESWNQEPPRGFIHKPRNSIYMPCFLKKVTSSDFRGCRFCAYCNWQAHILCILNFSLLGSLLSPKVAFTCHKKGNLQGRWFCAYCIWQAHIPCILYFSLLGSFLSPKVAFTCHSFLKRWPPVTSKAADFVLIAFDMFIYPAS